MKNITLVFSPFVVPSYIPLGIAQLKSYVEAKLPAIKVTNLDLNNQLFNNLAKKEYLDKFFSLLSFYPKEFKSAEIKKDSFSIYGGVFKMSVDFLRDKKSGVFYDLQKYNRFMTNALSFWRTWTVSVNDFTGEIIQKGLPITPELENIFKDDIEAISIGKPDLVGFSIFCKGQLFYSAILAKIIKKKLNLPIIFGGAFMSHIDIKEFLDIFDFVDFVVNQEGEISLVELAKNYSVKNINKVPGLYYRLAGKVAHNPEKFISHLDSLNRPDFSDFKLNGYLSPYPVLPIIFSRGCFWKKCSFCTYYKNYPVSYKTKSIKKIIAEIKHYNSQGIKHFVFNDDVISASDLNAISSALKESKIKIFFGAIVRVERGFSKPILRNIYKAGGRCLCWGVESSCQRILDLMNKGTKVKYIVPALKYAHQQGFHNHLFMMQEFPTQTKAEIFKDLRFLLSNKNIIDNYFIHKFRLQQKSYIFDNPDKFKIKNTRKETICKCIKNRNVLYDEVVTFEPAKRVELQKNSRKDTAILKRLGMIKRYNDLDQTHLLLHASR